MSELREKETVRLFSKHCLVLLKLLSNCYAVFHVLCDVRVDSGANVIPLICDDLVWGVGGGDSRPQWEGERMGPCFVVGGFFFCYR